MENITIFIYTYLFIGLAIVLWIVTNPLSYIKYLKIAISIIKKYTIKKENKTQLSEKELEQKQALYEKELDRKILKESLETNENPIKYNLTLIYLILAWPLLIFIFILALIIKLID